MPNSTDNIAKQWKLSPIDQEAQARWDSYTEAKEQSFALTDGTEARWVIVKSEDKMRGRLEAMRYFLSMFAYTDKDTTRSQFDPLIVAPVSLLKSFSERRT